MLQRRLLAEPMEKTQPISSPHAHAALHMSAVKEKGKQKDSRKICTCFKSEGRGVLLLHFLILGFTKKDVFLTCAVQDKTCTKHAHFTKGFLCFDLSAYK